jgi:hypothetical protein
MKFGSLNLLEPSGVHRAYYGTHLAFTLQKDKFTFFIITRSVLLRIRNISDRCCIENQNIQFIIDKILVGKSAFYEIMWKSTVQPGKPQIKIWLMRIACWITKSTNTHSEYCCSTETMFGRTRLHVTLYVRCFVVLVFVLIQIKPS